MHSSKTFAIFAKNKQKRKLHANWSNTQQFTSTLASTDLHKIVRTHSCYVNENIELHFNQDILYKLEFRLAQSCVKFSWNKVVTILYKSNLRFTTSTCSCQEVKIFSIGDYAGRCDWIEKSPRFCTFGCSIWLARATYQMVHLEFLLRRVKEENWCGMLVQNCV